MTASESKRVSQSSDLVKSRARMGKGTHWCLMCLKSVVSLNALFFQYSAFIHLLSWGYECRTGETQAG